MNATDNIGLTIEDVQKADPEFRIFFCHPIIFTKEQWRG